MTSPLPLLLIPLLSLLPRTPHPLSSHLANPYSLRTQFTCHLSEEVFLDAEGRIRCLCVAVIPISLPVQFYTPSKLHVCVYLVLAAELGDLTQQSFILVTNLQFGQGPVRTACPCPTRSRVSGGSLLELEHASGKAHS